MSYDQGNATALASFEPLGHDLLKGVRQIADFISESQRRTFYLCENGYIPAGKVGATWTASKRALREHYARVTSGERVGS